MARCPAGGGVNGLGVNVGSVKAGGVNAIGAAGAGGFSRGGTGAGLGTGAGGTGRCKAGAGVNTIGAAGAGGTTGGFARRGADTGVGVGARVGSGGVVDTGDFSGWVVKTTPLARLPNGPLMSAATSTLEAARRASRAGFKRGRSSPSGRLMAFWSCSPPELVKMPGASWRSSPKVIFTAPNASCDVTVSMGRLMVSPGGGTVMIFPRKSIGNAVMMGASGTAISLAFGGTFALRNGGGAGMEAAGLAGPTGATGVLVAIRPGTVAGGASCGSIRFNRLRSRLANLDLTMFGMTFVF